MQNNHFALLRLIAIVSMASVLSGCIPYALPLPVIPTQKKAEIISVEEGRAMVSMGSPYLYLERPTVDWQQARHDAAAHCLKWKGMPAAEPVGPTRRECLTYSGGDCIRYAIIGDYQCQR